MTNGTKIFLTLFALIVGTLVVYYGIIMPDQAAVSRKQQASSAEPRESQEVGQTETVQATAPEEQRAAPARREPAPLSQRFLSQPPQDEAAAGGLLTQGIRETEGAGGRGQAPHDTSAGDFAITHGVPQPGSSSGTLIPLIALNDGTFRSTSLDAPKGNASPDSARTSAQTSDQPASVVDEPPSDQELPTPPSHSTDTPQIEHAIKAGETFSSIARDWFGDSSKWSLIAKTNPTVDPQKLKIGQVILLPPKSAAAQSSKLEPSAGQGESIYTIKSGDSLIAISRWYFGVDDRWEEIYAHNRDVIGVDPASLKVGMKIRLPKK